MREIIIKELFCQGFSRNPPENFPIKRYNIQEDLIELEIIPFKGIYLKDLLLSLKKYANLRIVVRGDIEIDMEGVHKEKGENEIICYLGKEILLEGKIFYSPDWKREIFRGKIYPGRFPKMKKVYLIVKEGSLEEYLDIVEKLRERAVVIVDEKRTFEKVAGIGRKMGVDYVILLDKLTRITGDGIVYDVKMQRKKRRNVFEVV